MRKVFLQAPALERELVDRLDQQLAERRCKELAHIKAAVPLLVKLDPMLPPHWEMRYDLDQWIWIQRWPREDAPVGKGEFAGVCSLVQQATGLKVDRKASTSGELLYGLEGTCRVEVKVPIPGSEDVWNSAIWVVVKLNDVSNCRYDVVTEMVEQKRVVLSEGCLGWLENGAKKEVVDAK